MRGWEGFAVWLNDFGKEAVQTHENIFLCYNLLVLILNMSFKILPKNVTPHPRISYAKKYCKAYLIGVNCSFVSSWETHIKILGNMK